MDQIAILTETEDRDPQNYNAYLKVAFSDVISEPSAVHSPTCSYQFTKLVYDYTVYFTYSFFTIAFGGLLSFLYGLSCGILSFFFIWVAAPFVRFWLIPLGLVGNFWMAFVKCFYDPYFESCGKIFSNMNINFNHRYTIQNV